VVATDTGAMHLAAAVGAKVVALFGPTAPWRTGPYGRGHRVLRLGLECSPCFRRECERPVCLTGLEPEKVLEETAAVLAQGAA
jgi:ADP-heptose:LPS heptosyltransferase